ncbi:hypothetical protein Pan44_36090 [Caulifigura coniformis]|uniref:Glycoside hydrolase family 42 N-terminal domain-containing protein n=1 Tax=Caulifigura coniformis TaxID=2527983 RepID=A0A517SHH0_9PLAN|nr:hypothetical protein [Caulifigura coniformis]QDT55565.1 hypothetical protein Pan44_36090 [Caulifigura coniformis]
MHKDKAIMSFRVVGRSLVVWAVLSIMSPVPPTVAQGPDRSPQLDEWGGWTDVKGRKTGWFHLESRAGRTFLVTPGGNGFVALGVNHLNAIKGHGPGEPDLFQTKYRGDWAPFVTELTRQFDDWGFNTVDDGVPLLRSRLPYFASRDLVRTSKYYQPPGSPRAWEFPDVFDPQVAMRLERDVELYCREHRDNPNLIAYYWTDTPTWDIQKTRQFRKTDWVSEVRRLPASAPGKRRYAEFLRQRYDNDLARVSRAYDLGNGVKSVDDLAATDFRGIDLGRYDVARDDEAFLGVIAETYYGLVGRAMRQNDPHHLIFGEKYLLGDIPPQVLSAALPFVDAIAVQPGDGYIPIYTPGDVLPRQELAELRTQSGKPLMICDHQIGFPTERYPRSIWPYHQRADAAEAAAATEQFVRDAFARPEVIGYMRCQYIDRFTTFRDAVKLGLIRDDGSPREELVGASRAANAAVKETLHMQLTSPSK